MSPLDVFTQQIEGQHDARNGETHLLHPLGSTTGDHLDSGLMPFEEVKLQPF